MTGFTCNAARSRVFACSAGLALVAAIVWSVATAAQPAKARSAPASERQKRQVEGASLRDYVAVRSSVDRSAIWIGDRFSYIVDVECSHGTDILTDDMSRDRLQVDELDVLGVEETRQDAGEGRTVYRFTYRLTTYSIEPASKRIGEMRLRYYVRRPGQRPEDIEPAGEVTVPGAIVYVRSLLPDETNNSVYRSERAAVPRAAVFSALQPIGIGLVIVSVVPAVVWTAALLRGWRHRRRRISVRQLRHDERHSLDDLRALHVEAENGRREVFDRLSVLLRTHVAGVWGVKAEGLTAAEIVSALSAAGKGEVSAEATALLASCETARYGPPEGLPSRAACLAAIDRAEQLIGLGSPVRSPRADLHGEPGAASE